MARDREFDFENIMEHLAHAWSAGGYDEFNDLPVAWPPTVSTRFLMAGGRAQAAYHIAAVIGYVKEHMNALAQKGAPDA